MPASVTVGVLCAVAALLAAKAGAWGLFQRKVMKETSGLLARRAEVVLAAAGLLAALAVALLVTRPF
ncbi:MAG TPA: hypothetical protein PLO65_00865 [Caulobacter sp.]|nr:hypothetical protein [Caulobacter sp.]